MVAWVASHTNSCVVGGRRYVPCRYRGGAMRRLSLDYWDGGWNADYRFLAVWVKGHIKQLIDSGIFPEKRVKIIPKLSGY